LAHCIPFSWTENLVPLHSPSSQPRCVQLRKDSTLLRDSRWNTVGMTCIMTLMFILGRWPQHFWLAHFAFMLVLIPFRYVVLHFAFVQSSTRAPRTAQLDCSWSAIRTRPQTQGLWLQRKYMLRHHASADNTLLCMFANSMRVPFLFAFFFSDNDCNNNT
jgi:hypothetical protein